jgi:hypothetical protein
MMATDGDDKADRAQRFLFRHFLSLAWAIQPVDSGGKPVGEAQGFCASGTFCRYRGNFSLLTAGHVLDEIDAILANRQAESLGCYLMDAHGLDAEFRQPIPFVYEDAPKGRIYHERDGIDFGVILLSDYYLAMLQKNNVVPTLLDEWTAQEKIEWEWYLMLGLPASDTKVVMSPDKKAVTEFHIKPTIITLKRRKRLPRGSKPTSYRRFIGQINKKAPIDDIKGMSGGPIYGFKQTPEGLLYNAIAVQSSWLKSRKVTFGCPVPVIGRILDEAHDRFARDQ